jgi:flagellar basal body rod protein FlgB
MNLNVSPVTDNLTELLNRIIDFTERRKEVLTRNLFDYRSAGFEPMDLPVHEFADTLTRGLAEYIRNKRLVLEDGPNVHFHDQGEFEAAAVVDNKSLELLRNDTHAYVQEQIQRLSENLIHNRLAVELLRQKRKKETQFANLQ